MCVSVNLCVHNVPTEAHKKASKFLELEFKKFLSHPMWVLGIEPRSSGRTELLLEAQYCVFVLKVLILQEKEKTNQQEAI